MGDFIPTAAWLFYHYTEDMCRWVQPICTVFLVSNFFSLPKYHYFSKQSKNETNQKPITMHDNLAVGYGGQG